MQNIEIALPSLDIQKKIVAEMDKIEGEKEKHIKEGKAI